MDPYLEGALWPDVHHQLASEIRRVLSPRLRPRYVARIEVSVIEDGSPELELGILYPDVEVLRREPEPGVSPRPAAMKPLPSAPLLLPILLPVSLRVPSVEIRTASGEELVTAIEIASPINKRKPQLAAYREKRRRLRRAGVHLLEVDLIRRGTRGLSHARLPACDYLVALTRAGAAAIEAWPLRIEDALPVVPVPLRPPDADVFVDLGDALGRIYQEAAYDLSIDYRASPPPPALTTEQEAWRRTLFAGRGG
jgi:hypothetical protein